MSITLEETLHENSSELREKGCGVDDDNEKFPDRIPNPYSQQDTPTYKPWGWDVIDSEKSAVHLHERASLSESLQTALHT